MRLSAEVLLQNLEVDLLNVGYDYAEDPHDHRQYACRALFSSLIKKFHNEKRNEPADNSALQLFLGCNDRCMQYNSIVPNRLDEEYVLGEFRRLVYEFFTPSYFEPILLNRSRISAGFRWGPGSNIGSRSTDFYSKSTCSRMSFSNPLLVQLIERDLSFTSRLWSDVEVSRSKRFGYEQVKGSRLSFVPKTRDISRTICTEPLLNMLYQQGIASIIEERLRNIFSIDFAVQPSRNVRLARIGSVTGEFGTIDLSSASDTISLSLVKEIVPPESLRWLMAARSPYTILPDGGELELHMISSMGNAFTFPLQTMIFACLVAAAYRVYEIPFLRPGPHTDGNFAVFGDDIIVRREVYDVVTRCLGILGFTVNRNKSFNEGPFRESCGSDWLSGYNVRGVYISRLLTDGDVYSAINRLNRWSAYHDVPLVNTVGYLRRGCRFIGVPYDEADDAGIKVPLSLARHARGDLHGTFRYMALCNLPLHAKLPVVGYGDNVSHREVEMVRRLLPDFIYDSDGILLSVVAGYLRAGQVSLRLNSRKAVLRRRTSPGWDRWPSATAEEQSFGERWKSLVGINLS